MNAEPRIVDDEVCCSEKYSGEVEFRDVSLVIMEEVLKINMHVNRGRL